MSKITEEEKEMLEKATIESDDEAFHSTFDMLLEMKLEKLDSEWMKEMEELYDKSNMARWCA